ncbi:MAG: hypothetical protein EPN94_08795 [Nitrospirae bacterium]|nr:MAG: hypothetical protein EPN94_08795 [Nitrospirota bacterium]
MKQNTAFSIQHSAFRNKKTVILTLVLVFHYSLFTIHCSLSYAESLSDIKLAALQSPVKIVSEKWGRDPFVRYEDKSFKKTKEEASKEDMFLDLKLDGIISDGKKAMAIINGGFYRKNEKVNGFLIVGIGKDEVILEKDGKRFPFGIKKFAITGTPGGGKK